MPVAAGELQEARFLLLFSCASSSLRRQAWKLQGRAGIELPLKLPVDSRNIYFLYLF